MGLVHLGGRDRSFAARTIRSPEPLTHEAHGLGRSDGYRWETCGEPNGIDDARRGAMASAFQIGPYVYPVRTE